VKLRPKARKRAFKDEKTPASDTIRIDNDGFPSHADNADKVKIPEPVAEESEKLVIGNNILWGHYDNIAYMLEMNWHKIGWKLGCLRTPTPDRTPDVIKEALEPLCDQTGHDLIPALLRPTSAAATHPELKKTYKSLVYARRKLISAQRPYDSQLEKCQVADRAVLEANPKQRESLQPEITRRISNRIKFRKKCQTTQSRITVAREKLHKAAPPLREAVEIEISTLQAEYEKLQKSLETEDKIFRDLMKRHDAATNQHWAWAKEEAAKRRAKLNQLDKQLQECRSEIRRIETIYENQAAGFARKDLLRFIEEHRCLHHPGQLARAIAGLPILSCRESFKRSGESPFPREAHQNYELFEVIARAWDRRDPDVNDPQLHIQLFEDEISGLPKTKKWRGQEVPNFVREKFESNRQELREAILECLRLNSLPGEVPYIIAAKFLDNISRQKQQQQTPLERILSERRERK
jgi:hypothetical protein